MKINIFAIGKIKEHYLREGIAEFSKRLKPYCTLSVVEYAEEKMPETPSAAELRQALDREGEKLLAAVPAGSLLIVLDVAGKALPSEKMAELLAQKAVGGISEINFIIGGAYGLSDKIRQRADMLLSFSAMTFTHQMIRLLLVEQIYRAFKIWRGEKYHN